MAAISEITAQMIHASNERTDLVESFTGTSLLSSDWVAWLFTGYEARSKETHKGTGRTLSLQGGLLNSVQCRSLWLLQNERFATAMILSAMD